MLLVSWLVSDSHIEIIPPLSEYVMTCDEIENLRGMYVALYPTKEISHLNRVCAKMNKISFGGELLSSEFGNSNRNSCISAFWKSPQHTQLQLRIGHIQYMLKHKATIQNETVEHIVAYVHWFKKHPEEMYFGSSAYVVRNDFYQHTTFCYIPIQRLNARMCFGKTTIYPASPNSENVTVAIPVPFNVYPVWLHQHKLLNVLYCSNILCEIVIVIHTPKQLC